MAVNYNTTLKNSRMTAVRDAIAGGTLQILAGATVLSTHTLATPAGSVANGVLTLAFDADTVAAVASGTATVARIQNSGGTDVITSLTVGTSGADVIMQNTNVNSGQEIQITSATITHG